MIEKKTYIGGPNLSPWPCPYRNVFRFIYGTIFLPRSWPLPDRFWVWQLDARSVPNYWFWLFAFEYLTANRNEPKCGQLSVYYWGPRQNGHRYLFIFEDREPHQFTTSPFWCGTVLGQILKSEWSKLMILLTSVRLKNGMVTVTIMVKKQYCK